MKHKIHKEQLYKLKETMWEKGVLYQLYVECGRQRSQFKTDAAPGSVLVSFFVIIYFPDNCISGIFCVV